MEEAAQQRFRLSNIEIHNPQDHIRPEEFRGAQGVLRWIDTGGSNVLIGIERIARQTVCVRFLNTVSDDAEPDCCLHSAAWIAIVPYISVVPMRFALLGLNLQISFVCSVGGMLATVY